MPRVLLNFTQAELSQTGGDFSTARTLLETPNTGVDFQVLTHRPFVHDIARRVMGQIAKRTPWDWLRGQLWVQYFSAPVAAADLQGPTCPDILLSFVQWPNLPAQFRIPVAWYTQGFTPPQFAAAWVSL